MTQRIVAVANQKGGSVKTTTAVNMGGELAKMGHSVCVVDLDPQGNASQHLGIYEHKYGEVLAQAILGREPLGELAKETCVEGLDIVASGDPLADLGHDLARRPGNDLYLRQSVSGLAHDFVFLDCPPATDQILTRSALIAAQEVLIPIGLGHFEVDGLVRFMVQIEETCQVLASGLHVSAIVPCKHDARTTLHDEILQDVRDAYGELVTDAYVSQAVTVARAAGSGKPVGMFAPKSRASAQYRQIAEEFAGRE